MIFIGLIDLFGAVVCTTMVGGMFAFTVATIRAACQTGDHGTNP